MEEREEAAREAERIHGKQSQKDSPAAVARQKESNGAAYATPVINDRELLDTDSLMSGQKKRPLSKARGEQKRKTPSNLMPSHIGDLDMLRVREAEKVGS